MQHFDPGFYDKLADNISRTTCSRPMNISGQWIVCGSGDPDKCRSCARLFRDDWRSIGLSGCSPNRSYYWITLTLGSFGAVHFVPAQDQRRRCDCGRYHRSTETGLRGVPIDMDTYDYPGQLNANRDSAKLWNNTLLRLHRMFDFEHLVAKELQARGAVHLHLIVAPTGGDLPIEPQALADGISAVTSVSAVTGQIATWGNVDVRAVAQAAPDDAGGLIEYAIKSVVSYALKRQGTSGSDSSDAQKLHRRHLDYTAAAVKCSPACPAPVCTARVHRTLLVRRQPVSTSKGWSVGERKTRKTLRKGRAEWVQANPDLARPPINDATADSARWAREWEQSRRRHPDDPARWMTPERFHQRIAEVVDGPRREAQAAPSRGPALVT